jgi:hypothetical protein
LSDILNGYRGRKRVDVLCMTSTFSRFGDGVLFRAVLLRRGGRAGARRVNETFHVVNVFCVALAEADRLKLGIVELEVLHQIVSNHQRLGLGQEFIFLIIAFDSGRGRDHGQPEWLLIEKLSGLGERLTVFNFDLSASSKSFDHARSQRGDAVDRAPGHATRL